MEVPFSWICPVCKTLVVKQVRRMENKETGKREYAGEFYSCPNNMKDHPGQRYSVSPDTGKANLTQ